MRPQPEVHPPATTTSWPTAGARVNSIGVAVIERTTSAGMIRVA